MDEKITKIKLTMINRFVGKNGKNTRDAMPVLSSGGYVFFPSELTPDLRAERDDAPAEGQTKPPFIGLDKEHPFGVVLWDMVYGPNANMPSKKFFIKLFRVHQPAIYSIAMSVYRIGQRDPVEVVQDEDGFLLVDGFVRLVCCIVRDILAEMAQNPPHGTIRAQIVEETDQAELEDISLHKNLMRVELSKTDQARRFYELSLLGRENEAVEGEEEEEEEEGKKKKKKKSLSDKEIAKRCGLPDKGGRQKVFQFRTIYEWCLKQGARGQTYLAKWDAGQMTLGELLEKATAKPGSAASRSEPQDRKTTRPRCLSYPAAYKLWTNDDALSKAIETMHPEVPLKTKLELVRYGLAVAMQQADKQKPEAPATEPAATTGRKKRGKPATEPVPDAPADTEDDGDDDAA